MVEHHIAGLLPPTLCNGGADEISAGSAPRSAADALAGGGRGGAHAVPDTEAGAGAGANEEGKEYGANEEGVAMQILGRKKHHQYAPLDQSAHSDTDGLEALERTPSPNTGSSSSLPLPPPSPSSAGEKETSASVRLFNRFMMVCVTTLVAAYVPCFAMVRRALLPFIFFYIKFHFLFNTHLSHVSLFLCLEGLPSLFWTSFCPRIFICVLSVLSSTSI
jgi:hypothetical protein